MNADGCQPCCLAAGDTDQPDDLLAEGRGQGCSLQFEKAECMITVYVNNKKAASVVKDDPYVDLSAYAGQGWQTGTYPVRLPDGITRMRWRCRSVESLCPSLNLRGT